MCFDYVVDTLRLSVSLGIVCRGHTALYPKVIILVREKASGKGRVPI